MEEKFRVLIKDLSFYELEILARSEGITVTALVNDIISEYLESH